MSNNEKYEFPWLHCLSNLRDEDISYSEDLSINEDEEKANDLNDIMDQEWRCDHPAFKGNGCFDNETEDLCPWFNRCHPSR